MKRSGSAALSRAACPRRGRSAAVALLLLRSRSTNPRRLVETLIPKEAHSAAKLLSGAASSCFIRGAVKRFRSAATSVPYSYF
ncbi:hypothetical protein AAVH_21562 [Aphelenchoides avenae]|nr:hypothetical protein AAVH_21562 [Aphelenchus avenae]